MKIDLLKGETPEVLLMNALAKHYSVEEMFGKLKVGDGSDTEVILTVNGFEVPFDSIVQNIFDQCEQVHDDEVVNRAIRLVNFSGLEDLKEAMRSARETIKNAMEDAVRKLNK